MPISIHAPQWGATSAKPTTTDESEFQSTHPSGVRLLSIALVTPLSHFNPRTPVGCDWMQARGLLRMAYFNPRTPVGCDAQWSFGRRLQMLFQSTHPSGVRRPSTRRASPTRHFNPRTPVGCDVPTAPPLFDANNFNPRTPVGCDRRPAIAGDPQRPISIHAPQWGATRTGTTITNG